VGHAERSTGPMNATTKKRPSVSPASQTGMQARTGVVQNSADNVNNSMKIIQKKISHTSLQKRAGH
jgi:hypothetical protein